MNAPLPALSHYQLLDELSSGGMGTVYLARDERNPGFEKLVALKRIHPHLAKDSKFVAMFLDEARIASLIRHANVCGVEDFGSAEGEFFLTMEFLTGQTLAEVCRALHVRSKTEPSWVWSPRFFAMAARLLADACEGLHAAHEISNAHGQSLDLVHRDVSPPNLFVGFDGVLKVLDFGIAKARDRIAETTAGGVKGKLAYMAPEQVEGGELDRRTDIWALGVVAFELLTLTRLFKRGSDVDTLKAVAGSAIPLVSDRVPDVPAELDATVQRALSRDPGDRFATAREMGRQFTNYLSECGHPSGLADVSEWVTELFPGKQEQSQRSVSAAMQRVGASGPLAADEATPRLERTGPLPTETSAAKAGAATAPGVQTPTAHVGPGTEVPPARRRWPAALLLGGFALVAGGFGFQQLSGRDTSSIGRIAAAGVQGPHAESTGIPGTADGTTADDPTTDGPTANSTTADDPTADSTTADGPTADSTMADSPTADSTTADDPTADDPAADEPPGDGVVQPPSGGRRGRRRRRAPPAEAQEPAADDQPVREGTVQVVTSGGWAQVRWQGLLVGTTPARITLPEGQHTLELRGEDGRVHRARVRVLNGQVSRVRVDLSQP